MIERKMLAKVYMGMVFHDHEVEVAVLENETTETISLRLPQERVDQYILNFLREYREKHHVKCIGIGISGDDKTRTIRALLWFEEDVVPFSFISTDAAEIARLVKESFTDDGIAKVTIQDGHEVVVSFLATLEDYKKTVSESAFKQIEVLAKDFTGKRISYFSATPQGGGVAIMRHALIRFFRLLGVDAHWYVLDNNLEAFQITKEKFHDILQAVAPPKTQLTPSDITVYDQWIAKNAAELHDVFTKSDIVVLDDPQPSGLGPYITKVNPQAKLIYRSHIQIEADLANTPQTPQHEVWQFMWEHLKDISCFISHPIAGFVPIDVPEEKVVFMPPSTDPLDGLNKWLFDWQEEYYFDLFNDILQRNGQTPLDATRSYIIEIARFDPSKGIPDVLEAYERLYMRLKEEGKAIPQLIITGNPAEDDPEGIPIYNETLATIATPRYEYLRGDIKVVQLPPIDQLLNTLVRKSFIVLQLSHKEGYEFKVTEALAKAKPVIAYRAGGIPLQIQDGVTGYLINVGDFAGVSEKLYILSTDAQIYQKISDNAARLYNKEVATIPNATKWLFLAKQLLEQGKITDKNLPKGY
jgi:glycosyltransferase involved in cell wall biosynthesis